MANLLSLLDVDGDSKISQAEWLREFGTMEEFQKADIDNDGVIDLSEWTIYSPKFELLHNLSNDSIEHENAAQVGGHAGGFRPGLVPGRILKKTNELEVTAFKEMACDDPAAPYCVKFFSSLGEPIDGEQWVEMENLLQAKNACVMDCKIGGRTFLESEAKNAKLRTDLATKMVKHTPGSLTADEAKKGITKLTYMRFRDAASSIKELKFRIEGYTTKAKDQKAPVSADKVECQKLQHEADVGQALNTYFSTAPNGTKWRVLRQLKGLEAAIPRSDFFKSHELIGSSLLFVYDPDGTYASVKMIDFGKTSKRQGLTHTAAWQSGNHEDEYVVGLRNIIRLIEHS